MTGGLRCEDLIIIDVTGIGVTLGVLIICL
jgi:hypothetical protein